MSVSPGLERSGNPGLSVVNVFSPAGAGHPPERPEDLPFQGRRLGGIVPRVSASLQLWADRHVPSGQKQNNRLTLLNILALGLARPTNSSPPSRFRFAENFRQQKCLGQAVRFLEHIDDAAGEIGRLGLARRCGKLGADQRTLGDRVGRAGT